MNEGYQVQFKTPEKDNLTTSAVTWKLILFLIRPDDILWDPAFYDGQCKTIFESFGHTMHHEKRDIFDPDTFEWAKAFGVNKLVCTPPFSQLDKWVPRIIEFDVPSIVLMPFETMQNKWYQNIPATSQFQVLVPPETLVVFTKSDGSVGRGFFGRAKLAFFVYKMTDFIPQQLMLIEDESGKIIPYPEHEDADKMETDNPEDAGSRKRTTRASIERFFDTESKVDGDDDDDSDTITHYLFPLDSHRKKAIKTEKTTTAIFPTILQTIKKYAADNDGEPDINLEDIKAVQVVKGEKSTQYIHMGQATMDDFQIFLAEHNKNPIVVDDDDDADKEE